MPDLLGSPLCRAYHQEDGRFAWVPLSPGRREGQQHIAGDAPEARVSGVDKYHPVNHYRAESIDRTPFNAVQLFETRNETLTVL
jgi:hypothetical protein